MRKYFTVMFSGFVIAGCDGAGTLELGVNANTALSFAAVGSSGLFGQSEPRDTMHFGTHTIVVSSAELRVSELELEGDDDKVELKGGSTVVNIAADGRLSSPINAQIATGTYDRLELDVNTVRIRGTYDGEPFDVTIAVNDEMEVEFDDELVISEATETYITVGLLMSSWFRNSDGSAIDPRSLTATVQGRLESNIRGSFEAYEDENRDGRR